MDSATDLLAVDALPRLIERQAERFPDRAAVEIGPRRLSYAEFARAIMSMTARMMDADVPADRIVAVDAGKPYLHWLALLAAQRLGLATISVSGALSAEALDRLRIGAVAGDGATFPGPLGGGRKRIAITDQGPPPQVAQPTRAAARIFQSSGTTGVAKAMVIDAERLGPRVAHYAAAFGPTETSRVAPLIGTGTALGYFLPLATWAAGGRVILPGDKSAAGLAAAVAAATIVLSSPVSIAPVLDALAASPPKRRNRKLFLAGARLSARLRDRALALLCDAVTMVYGSVETGVLATGDAALIDRDGGAVGFMADGATVEVVDGLGRPAPAGTAGIVRARTRCMAAGYWNDAGATRTFFRGGWFYPGDIGVLAADGMLSIDGRSGDVINIGGAKMSPAAIEHDLESIAGIDQAAAAALQRADGTDLLALAVVTAPDADWPTIEARIAMSMQGRPRAMTFRLPNLPRGEMGKLDRAGLAALLTSVLTDIDAKRGL